MRLLVLILRQKHILKDKENILKTIEKPLVDEVDQLKSEIIGAAIEVHRYLEPGLL